MSSGGGALRKPKAGIPVPAVIGLCWVDGWGPRACGRPHICCGLLGQKGVLKASPVCKPANPACKTSVTEIKGTHCTCKSGVFS